MPFVSSQTSRIFVGSLAWSQFTRSKSLSMDTAMLDTTTINDSDASYIPGVNSGTMSLDMLLDNSGAAGSQFITLNTWKGATQVVTLCFEGTTRGAPVWQAVADQANFTVNSGASDVVSVSGSYMTDGVVGYGVVIDPLTAITVDTNGTSVDNGAATSAGGIGQLHVTAFSGLTSNSVIVEHSVDNAAWSTLGTFTLATGLTSERITVAGTVNRYLRVRDDVTGTGSCTRIVSFARN
jgi:hypothetical protein